MEHILQPRWQCDLQIRISVGMVRRRELGIPLQRAKAAAMLVGMYFELVHSCQLCDDISASI